MSKRIFCPAVNWEVIFKRKNGTIGKDKFHSQSQSGALAQFAQCYRHGDCEIISCSPCK